MAVAGSKRVLALKKRKAREREQAFLIEGVRLCEEAVGSSPGDVEQLIFARDMLDNPRLAGLKTAAESNNITVQLTDRRALKGMCETETPQGVLGVARIPERDRQAVLSSGKTLIVLDRVRDPGNLGLILAPETTTHVLPHPFCPSFYALRVIIVDITHGLVRRDVDS